MADPAAEFGGERELRATLKAAGDDLSDLRAAHAEASRTVATEGRREAPVGKTGRLSASVRPGATKTAAVVRAGGGGVPYAGVQEFGWPARHIPAQPYLVPSVAQTEPQWRPAYLAAIQRILAKVKGV